MEMSDERIPVQDKKYLGNKVHLCTMFLDYLETHNFVFLWMLNVSAELE